MQAELYINKNFVIGDIDNRIYGSFIEQFGRAVYGGIYEPDHETADEMGFRQDVLEKVRKLHVPIVRYPGGNILSAYNWEDGTGDKAKRPQKLDLAWNTIEPNTVGIDEFQAWAKKAGTTVMMSVNLGTRGVEEARNCLEYCNGDTPTYYADMRRKNGFEAPFDFKLWCLGNEMGGTAQMCRKTPEEYGRLAAETGKVMKRLDPSIELIACGSSHRNMPRFGEWELVVLSHTYSIVDYLSIHQYYDAGANALPDLLAKTVDMDDYIKSVSAMCDTIKAIKKSDKTMYLSFDEWNVFPKDLSQNGDGKRECGSPRFEGTYTFGDALMVGCMMITLQKNSDRVKIACLAQLVNAIAPIMTNPGGKAWLQTIYYPFLYASLYGRGTALRTEIKCDAYSTEKHQNVPYLESAVIHNAENHELILFAVNRCMTDGMELIPLFENFGDSTLIEHIELYAENPEEKNTAEKESVRAQNVPIGEKIILKKHSWNMLRFSYTEC
ncbi:MAG: alpha-N-arabinofuranosidase [Ruminococcaceae bacterium]|nr:alpha-N-arabinofuranosidase [Oscillospiraceae bacterium]